VGKLFNLKKWLTVAETARHLTIIFGEEVHEADVLRLALDGRLQLSVNFVNYATARFGTVVRHTRADLEAAIATGKMPSLQIDNDRYLNLDDKVSAIEGVWDLPMVGDERRDIEHKYQMLTGGPSVSLATLAGTFVAKGDREMCLLQESYGNNEYQAGSSRDSGKDSGNYFPAGISPKNSVLVIRTDALREFEEVINGAPASEAKSLTTTERNTLLVIIAALCDHSHIEHQARGAAVKIANLTAQIGAAVTDDTIRKVLVQIPDALESRSK